MKGKLESILGKTKNYASKLYGNFKNMHVFPAMNKYVLKPATAGLILLGAYNLSAKIDPDGIAAINLGKEKTKLRFNASSLDAKGNTTNNKIYTTILDHEGNVVIDKKKIPFSATFPAGRTYTALYLEESQDLDAAEKRKFKVDREKYDFESHTLIKTYPKNSKAFERNIKKMKLEESKAERIDIFESPDGKRNIAVYNQWNVPIKVRKLGLPQPVVDAEGNTLSAENDMKEGNIKGSFLATLDDYVDAEGYMSLVPYNGASSEGPGVESKYGSKLSFDDKLRIKVGNDKHGRVDFAMEHERQGYENADAFEKVTNTDKRMRIGYLRNVKGVDISAGLAMPGQKFKVESTDETENPIAIDMDVKGKGGYVLVEYQKDDMKFGLLYEASKSNGTTDITNSAVPEQFRSFQQKNTSSEGYLRVSGEFGHKKLGRYTPFAVIEYSDKHGSPDNTELNLEGGIITNVKGVDLYTILEKGLEFGDDTIGSRTTGIKLGVGYKH